MARTTTNPERRNVEQAAVHRRANKGRWQVKALRPDSRNEEVWGTFDTRAKARDEQFRMASKDRNRGVTFRLNQI